MGCCGKSSTNVQPEGEEVETKRCCFCCCKRPVKPKKEENPFKEYKERKCTDCLCCIIFLVFWLGMLIIAAIGFTSGDPVKLLYGTDHNGNLCGTESRGKRIYFPRITEDLANFAISGDLTNPLDITLFGVCVEECPTFNSVVCTEAATPQLALAKTALSASSDSATVTSCQEAAHWDSPAACSDVRSGCWIVPLNSTEFFFRCVWTREQSSTFVETCLSPPSLEGKTQAQIPNEWDECVTKSSVETTTVVQEGQSNPLLELIYAASALFGRFMSDVGKALPVILVCGLLISFLAGFLWLVFMKMCASFLVWLTIWLCFLLLFAVTLVGYWKAGILTQDSINSATGSINDGLGTDVDVQVQVPSQLDKADEDQQQRWKYFAFVMTAVSIIYLVLLVFLRKAIKVAIGIIKEASTALRKMWSLMFFPIVTFVLLTLLAVYWILALAFVASAGSDEIAESAITASARNYLTAPNLLCPTKDVAGKTVVLTEAEMEAQNLNCTELASAVEFVPDKAKRYALIYHFFGLLWTLNFVVGMGIMIVSGAVSKWYFTRDKANKLPRNPCCSSTKRVCRYHLGSVAFGSLLIAVVQFLRACLAYLDNKTETLKGKSKIWAMVAKCVACCLWCFEKCLRYLTKYAYIIVAMKGTNFCNAGRQVIGIFMTNPRQIATTEAITTFLFIIGKVFVVTLSGVLAFAWFEKGSNYQTGEEDELDSMLVPLGLVCLLAFIVAKTFLDIYHLAIQTILTCYFEDLATHKGTAEDPYFMSASLCKAIGLAVHKVDHLYEDADEKNAVKPAGKGEAKDEAPSTVQGGQPYAGPAHPQPTYAPQGQPGYGPPQGQPMMGQQPQGYGPPQGQPMMGQQPQGYGPPQGAYAAPPGGAYAPPPGVPQ